MHTCQSLDLLIKMMPNPGSRSQGAEPGYVKQETKPQREQTEVSICPRRQKVIRGSTGCRALFLGWLHMKHAEAPGGHTGPPAAPFLHWLLGNIWQPLPGALPRLSAGHTNAHRCHLRTALMTFKCLSHRCLRQLNSRLCQD